MKKNIFRVLVMLLALCCLIVGCDNPANSGQNNGSTEENTDWWIGTWKSQIKKTTLESEEEINFYWLFEIKYNSDENGTFVCTIKDNDSGIIYNYDATESTTGYTCKGTWKFNKADDDDPDSTSDYIYLRDDENMKILEGGLRLDYEKQQLYIYNWETSLREYCTKIK